MKTKYGRDPRVCPKCEAEDPVEKYAFPRENFDDLEFECECGHTWILFVSGKIVDANPEDAK